MTNAQMAWPVVSSVTPTTAASATPECPTSADSTSAVEIRCPDTFITSSMRPSTQIAPSASKRAPSPAKYQALLGELGPVGLLVALRVAPDAAQHRRPRLVQHQVAGDVLGVIGVGLQRVAVVVDDLGRDAGQRRHRRTGFGRSDSRQRRDHRRTGLGLPPGVHDREAVRAEHLAVPAPGLGVDRFADRSQQPQAGQVVRVGDLTAPLHERADQRGRGVIDCDAVLFDDLEVPVLVGAFGCALVEHLGDAVGQRAVDDVGVPGDPADVGGAPEHVGFRLDVEDGVVGVASTGSGSRRWCA